MMLLAYRHGLRVSELMEARRADINFDDGRVWVVRKKGGLSTNQPLAGDEIRAVKAYLATRDDGLPWLFLSSQGGQMTRQNFNYLIAQAGERADLGAVSLGGRSLTEALEAGLPLDRLTWLVAAIAAESRGERQATTRSVEP